MYQWHNKCRDDKNGVKTSIWRNTGSKDTGFLIDHKGYEYPKMEIADNSDIEWASFNGHWILLEEWELVKGSRKIGNETRYTLNEENTLVSLLRNYHFSG